MAKGPNYRALKEFVEVNFPVLDRTLSTKSGHDLRRLLNQFTGLQLQPTDSVEAGSLKYLERLEQMEAALRGEIL